MKTILVPTDFSPAAQNAANYAIQLADYYEDLKILLLHIYSIPIHIAGSIVTPIQFEELEAEQNTLLKAFKKSLLKTTKKVEIELLSNPGFVVDEILRVHTEQNIDMTIMGIQTTVTESASRGCILSVIEQSKKPVLIVPDNIEFKKPEKIAFACDYSKLPPENVIKDMKEYANTFHAKILIFDVLKKDELISNQKALAEVNLENSLQDIDHTISFTSGDNLPQEINAFIKANKADVLIMMPHNYSFLQSIFHRSNTKEMVFHTSIPLLSIHE
jgi:nucleotide-binding universal stress UspA family protein